MTDNDIIKALEKEHKRLWAKAIKAEAIKEFAAKVKQEAAYCDPITDEMIWLESNFDNLVKEMTE